MTIYPEIFPGVLKVGPIGRALKERRWNLSVISLREFALGRYKSIDDYPFGGGAGMVVLAEVVAKAIDSLFAKKSFLNYKIIYTSPRGKVFSSGVALSLSKYENLVFICGRFEGIDERLLEFYSIEEISIGDYVLAGGEVAVQVIVETTLRHLPGVLGNHRSLDTESFSNGLLEHPHYTRPAEWRNMRVPSVLLSGNHKAITMWRKNSSERITKERRTDLWVKYIKKKLNE